MAERSQRTSGRTRKILIGIVGGLVVLVVLILIAGPIIGSAIVPGMIASAAKKQVRGGVHVDGVSLSWTGKQKITGLRLTDPDGGGNVVTMNGTLDRGLLGLVSNPSNLGTLHVEGTVDVVESKAGSTNLSRAVEAPPGKPKGAGGAGAGGTATPSGPLKLPKGFAVKIEGTNLEARYTTTDAAGTPVVVGLKNVAIDGGVKGSDATLTMTGDSLEGARALEVKAEALGAIAPDGTVDASKATITIDVTGEAPKGYIETLAGIVASANDGAKAKISLHLAGQGGRLRKVGDAPATVEIVVPAALARFGTDDAPGVSLHATAPIDVTLAISKLDIPLPTAKGYDGVDFRKSVIEATLTRGAVTAELRDGDTVRKVEGAPATIMVYSSGDNFDLGVLGKLALALDGVSSGDVNIDAKMVGILDPQDGTLRLPEIGKPSGPDQVRVQILAQSVPTALIQPFVQSTGVNLKKTFGDVVRVDIRAGQMGAHAAENAVEMNKITGEEGVPAEQVGNPYLAGAIESPLTTGYFDFMYDASAIRTRGKGVRIETDGAGEVARMFVAQDSGLALTGQGKAIITLTDLVWPVAGSPDLRKAKGTLRAIVGQMTALVGPEQTPIGLTSVDFEGTAAPGTALAWKLDARGSFEGKDFAALGSGSVPGLMAPASDTKAPLGLSIASARPQGELTLIDIPTGLARLVSGDAANLADAAFGHTMRGVISSTPSGDDSVDMKIRLEGNTATVDGTARLRKDAVEIGPEGITARFAQAGAVLNAANKMTGNERVSFTPDGVVTITAKDVRAPLGGPTDVKALAGALDVTVKDLIGKAKRAEGQDVSFSIVDGKVGATIAKGGAFDSTIAMKGVAAAKDMSITGGAKGTLPTSGDPTAVAQALNEASLEARNVPTALLGLFDQKTAAMAMEAAGDTTDISVKPAPGGKKEWVAQITGSSGFHANSDLRLAGNAFEIGPTAGALTITPGLVEAVMGDTFATMTPHPRLDGSVPVDLSAEAFRVAPGPAGWGLAQGEKISVLARAQGDTIARDVAQLGEGKTASVGVHGLELAATMDGKGVGATSISGQVFEPDTDTPVAKVIINAALPASPLVGDLHVTEGDVAALDKMLGMDGVLLETMGTTLAVDAKMEGAGGAVTAEAKSPRVTASASLKRGADGSMALTKPLTLAAKLGPKAVERFVLGAKPGEKAQITALGDVDVNAKIDTLALGPSATPLKPGVFALAGNIQTSAMALQKATGERVDVPALAGDIKSGQTPGSVVFQLASAPGSASAVKVNGHLDNLADAQGRVNSAGAILTADVDGKLPTALVDALGSLDGLASALLGTQLTVKAHAENFGREAVGGKMDGTLTSENASAKLAGQVTAPGVMHVANGSRIELTQVTKEASDQVLGVLVPFLTSFEKTKQDQPATVVFNNLDAPLDGNTQNLNGDVVLDLGTMRFQTKSFFGKLLKISGQKDAGKIGERIEPVTFVVNSGVATYEKMIVPAGEFTMESYGKINLNKKKLDIYVLVPLYALAEEFAAGANKIPGLDRLTQVPISIKGSFDNPETKLDLEELVKRVPGAIGSGAEGVIGGVLGGILGDKASDGDKDGDDKKELTPEEKAAKQQKKKEKEEAERLKKEEKKKKKKDGGG